MDNHHRSFTQCIDSSNKVDCTAIWLIGSTEKLNMKGDKTKLRALEIRANEGGGIFKKGIV